ncbi:MAG: hypothetical protein IKW80_11735, partial [Thermoguttaceae bacterium]|nr:hypothetical protein [Thermoguttaceae bacterium]
VSPRNNNAGNVKMEGGNGATNGSAVTLRRATGVNPWGYCRLHIEKPGSRQSPAAEALPKL